MNKWEVINILKSFARLFYPDIPEDEWTLMTIEWSDNTYHIEYFNSYENRKRHVFCYSKGIIRHEDWNVINTEEYNTKEMGKWNFNLKER